MISEISVETNDLLDSVFVKTASGRTKQYRFSATRRILLVFYPFDTSTMVLLGGHFSTALLCIIEIVYQF